MQRLSIALIAVIAWLSLISTAIAAPANPEARARATEAHERARAAEAEMRFADAMAAYREAATTDPSAPFAPGAQVRSRWLERRSEGNFEPLTVLERFRRDPAAARDPARLDALAKQAERFPSGLVRTESFLAIADAFKELGDLQRAMAAWQRVIEDDQAPKGERVIALRATVETNIDRGEWAAARDAALRWGELAPTVRDKALKLHRRMLMTRTSVGLIAVLVAAGSYALVRLISARGLREIRRGMSWKMLVFPVVVTAGGGGFAWWNEGHGMQPFLIFGPGMIALILLARACRVAFPSIPARAAVAVVGALAAISLAWLSMLGSPGLMEGFGL